MKKDSKKELEILLSELNIKHPPYFTNFPIEKVPLRVLKYYKTYILEGKPFETKNRKYNINHELKMYGFIQKQKIVEDPEEVKKRKRLKKKTYMRRYREKKRNELNNFINENKV